MREFWHGLRRWDKALLVLVALYLGLWPIEPVSRLVLGVRVALQVGIYLMASVIVIRIVAALGRALTRRFLWRVRHRLIAVYLFVGIIPLSLALLLAVFGLGLFLGPIAAYIVSARLEQRSAELHATAASLGWEFRAADPGERREIARRFLAEAESRYPGILARFDTPRGPAGYPPDFRMEDPPAAMANYHGVVRRDHELFVAAHAQFSQDAGAILLMIPLTNDYLAELLPGLGVVGVPDDLDLSSLPLRKDSGLRLTQPPGGSRGLDRIPPPASPFDYERTWLAEVPVLDWSTGDTGVKIAFILRTRLSAVVRLIMASQTPGLARFSRIVAYVLGGLFVAALAVSFVIAISLTRTLTQAIHELYVGTLHIHQGDFSHRIALRGDDQLAELAGSFNTMTASIERLIVDSREKQRLQSELDIAREVQAQLFPRIAPTSRTLEVLGVCRPAESVSGDFYDYVQLSPRYLALAFGDVSGKGISAALVMAALHSIVRTQLSVLTQNDGPGPPSAANLVSRTNAQLFSGISPEKFSTLFFGIYDEQESVLSYSNAGHLPPVLIRGGQARRFDVNGMVVGAFSDNTYESSRVELKSGDLIVAFTDGVTEPENAYGEEFGEDRLVELLVRNAGRPIGEIVSTALEEVIEWTGHSKLQDDMTMLVARRR